MGLVIGLFISVIRVSYDTLEKPNMILRILNRIVTIYVSVIRGIPVIVQVLLWSFVLLAASRNHLLIGSMVFGVNSGAYVSEVFRGGITSIDKGQTEAGRSLGLSYMQTMIRIILPQAIKNCLPAFGNEFISLLKETSVASVGAITEITHVQNIIRGRTFDPSPLFFVAAIYLILVLFLEFLVRIMEKKLSKSDMRVKKIKRTGLRVYETHD